MSRKISRYGWKPDLPDFRDLTFETEALPVPQSVDLRGQFPFEPWDQGQLGSCTAHGVAGVVTFGQQKQGLQLVMPSRLFIYYEERVLEGDPSQDNGAEIRDGMKVVAKQGYPAEALWPYDIAKFAEAPPAGVVQEAAADHVTKYLRVRHDLISMLGCLAAGYPFVFGFTVYESFESDQVAKTGVVPMPAATEKVLGGHAVVACGYDQVSKVFYVRNSWGTSWGQEGYFTIPFAYLASRSLSSDLWTVRLEAQA